MMNFDPALALLCVSPPRKHVGILGVHIHFGNLPKIIVANFCQDFVCGEVSNSTLCPESASNLVSFCLLSAAADAIWSNSVDLIVEPGLVSRSVHHMGPYTVLKN